MKEGELASTLTEVKSYLQSLQHAICEGLSEEDGVGKFHINPWSQPNFGSGVTRVLTAGRVIEKGGVNFSHVYGDRLPASASASKPELTNAPFHAMGVSLVIHPDNPYVPTSHANVRFFIALPKNSEPVWWFGGGYDLTPYYGFDEDCVHWHRTSKEACEPFGADVYSRYKKWCDDYFYLKHRNEPRGVGGLFFDDLNEWDFNTSFDFMRSIGNSYIKAYRPIMAKRKTMTYSDSEKQFQLYRRGRYVEFNLIYDRGTMFGLQTKGRTEAVLMSMPPQASWVYDWQPEMGSAEENLTKHFLINKEWV